MPESLLTILKLSLIALLWLFFLRVLRAVWAELASPRPVASPGPPPAQPRSRRTTLRLEVIEPPEHRGRSYDLGEELTVGRATGCGVALEHDVFVSQLHARVFSRNSRLYVEDLGSTNGTYLNAQKVSAPVALRRGDRLQVGRTVLEVSR